MPGDPCRLWIQGFEGTYVAIRCVALRRLAVGFSVEDLASRKSLPCRKSNDMSWVWMMEIPRSHDLLTKCGLQVSLPGYGAILLLRSPIISTSGQVYQQTQEKILHVRGDDGSHFGLMSRLSGDTEAFLSGESVDTTITRDKIQLTNTPA